MQGMRRERLAVLAVVLSLLFVACGTVNNTNEEASGPESVGKKVKWVCSNAVGNGFFTEQYALYHDRTGRLQLFDTASGKDIVYCFDAGCPHEYEKKTPMGEIIQKGCVAYSFSPAAVMLWDGRCYFLQDNGEVYLADLQGENRRLIGRLPSYVLQKDTVAFTDEYLFVFYQNSYRMIELKDEKGNSQWIVGEPMDQNTCGVIRMSLKDGKCLEIFHQEEYNARIAAFDIRDDHLYLEYFYLDEPYDGFIFDEPDFFEENVEETLERQWEERLRHQWIDILDYSISGGKMNTVLSHVQCRSLVFCNDFFALAEGDGHTGLYRYSGQKFRQLDFEISKGVYSETGLICNDMKQTSLYRYVDENSGEIIKTVEIPNSEFLPDMILGASCYGNAPGKDGWGAGFLSTEDFWAGRCDNICRFRE